MDSKEKVIAILRKTRKAFLIEYGCGFLLLVFLIILNEKEIYLKAIFSKAIFGLAVFSMLTAEYSRITHRYLITSDKISYIKGIIKQSRKNIYFAPLSFIPNINLRQNRIQRLLDYGTISISGISGESMTNSSFELRDISNPHKVLKIIEEWIDYHRNKNFGAQRPDVK